MQVLTGDTKALLVGRRPDTDNGATHIVVFDRLLLAKLRWRSAFVALLAHSFALEVLESSGNAVDHKQVLSARVESV